ncbi:MAG: hypothetical protein HYZ28_20795 [Myxococcales bacterium]|nr:hypothetical protein [Myxococcales bacterium]
MSARPLLLSLALPALLSCPARESAEDRLFRKLEEAQRTAPEQGRAMAPQKEKLAQIATGGGRREGALPLLGPNPTVHLGPLAFKLTEIEASQSVSGGKVALSTEDTFLRVRLLAQNVAEAPQTLDLTGARLSGPGGREFSLARDAQRAAGTRELRRSFPPGERVELALYFELPSGAVGAGLALVLAAPDGGEPLRLPLQ